MPPKKRKAAPAASTAPESTPSKRTRTEIPASAASTRPKRGATATPSATPAKAATASSRNAKVTEPETEDAPVAKRRRGRPAASSAAPAQTTTQATEAPKAGRGRAKKEPISMPGEDVVDEHAEGTHPHALTSDPPKRRGRPKKNGGVVSVPAQDVIAEHEHGDHPHALQSDPPKKRGRPGRQAAATEEVPTLEQEPEPEPSEPPKKRGRPGKKVVSVPAEDVVAEHAHGDHPHALESDPPKKRGRPGKPVATEDAAVAPAPEASEPSKKRGRAATKGAKSEAVEEPPKKRGRPASKPPAAGASNDTASKTRGRPKAAATGSGSTKAAAPETPPVDGTPRRSERAAARTPEKPAATTTKEAPKSRGRPKSTEAKPEPKPRGRPKSIPSQEEPKAKAKKPDTATAAPKIGKKAAEQQASAPEAEAPKRRGRPPQSESTATASKTASTKPKARSAPNKADVTKATAKAGRPAKAPAIPIKTSEKPAAKRGPKPKTAKSTTTTGEASASAAEADQPPRPWFWLMKAEPESRIEKGVDVKFSIDDLAAVTEPEPWNGVRNHVAKNNMLAMKKGELAFFYHSNCKVPGVYGIMEIVEEATPDESAFDSAHPYYDEKSSRDAPRWFNVKVSFKRRFEEPITLTDLKYLAQSEEGEPIASMELLKLSRLSVSKVKKSEWDFIMDKVENGFDDAEEGDDDEPAVLEPGTQPESPRPEADIEIVEEDIMEIIEETPPVTAPPASTSQLNGAGGAGEDAETALNAQLFADAMGEDSNLAPFTTTADPLADEPEESEHGEASAAVEMEIDTAAIITAEADEHGVTVDETIITTVEEVIEEPLPPRRASSRAPSVQPPVVGRSSRASSTRPASRGSLNPAAAAATPASRRAGSRAPSTGPPDSALRPTAGRAGSKQPRSRAGSRQPSLAPQAIVEDLEEKGPSAVFGPGGAWGRTPAERAMQSIRE